MVHPRCPAQCGPGWGEELPLAVFVAPDWARHPPRLEKADAERQAHAEARLLPTSLRPHLVPPTPMAPGTWAGQGAVCGARGELCPQAPTRLWPRGSGLGMGSGRHTEAGAEELELRAKLCPPLTLPTCNTLTSPGLSPAHLSAVPPPPGRSPRFPGESDCPPPSKNDQS